MQLAALTEEKEDDKYANKKKYQKGGSGEGVVAFCACNDSQKPCALAGSYQISEEAEDKRQPCYCRQ